MRSFLADFFVSLPHGALKPTARLAVTGTLKLDVALLANGNLRFLKAKGRLFQALQP